MNPYINKYRNELNNIISYGGSLNETTIRRCFISLVNDIANEKNLILVEELDYKTPQGNTVYPDGTLKDKFRLTCGFYEAKDPKDDLEKEIKDKISKNYPLFNTIFENSKIAVLYQNGLEILRIDMSIDIDLIKLLYAFINFERQEVDQFHKAVEQFKIDLPNLVSWCRTEIETARTNSEFIKQSNKLLEQCRAEINPDFSFEDIREILIQHMLTDKLFKAVFNEVEFHNENNIAKSIDFIVKIFFDREKKKQFEDKNRHFYNSIERTAVLINDHHEKQDFLKTLYEEFYKSYNPKEADRLGVIYTPTQIVNFMVRITDSLLYKHFNTGLAENDVKIIDPATGTGTFITEIIDFIPPQKLKDKYLYDLFANEVGILPYYVSSLNIEYTYWQKMNEYKEFPNICYTDTLDNAYYTSNMDKHGQLHFLNLLTEENSKRLIKQNESKISVVIGNPPYNANQQNFNHQNANRKYPKIDERIRETFSKQSSAQKKKYEDMYLRFYRWAMDRLDDKNGGIIAFITNRSFIDAIGTDGFRKIVSKEFDYLYILDTQSDVRKNPKISGTKNNVFGIQTGVAIMFAIKNPKDKQKKPIIYYHTLKDEETKDEKLQYLKKAAFNSVKWERIYPDENDNWLNITDNDYDSLIPICSKEEKENTIFSFYTLGVSTNRDEWVYDFSKKNLINKMKYFSDTYNQSLQKNEMNPSIKWSRDLRDKFNRKQKSKFKEDYCIYAVYRPYILKNLYSEKMFNDVMTENHYKMFGNTFTKNNSAIHFSGLGHSKIFSCIAYKNIFSLDSIEKGQCVPLFIYNENDKVDNITAWALNKFIKKYKDKNITKEAIFYYVYSSLHDPNYIEKYKDNLKLSFPRIPFHNDFWKWSNWGKELLNLHIDYENAEEYNLEIVNRESEEIHLKPIFKVDKENGTIILDEKTTLKGFPPEIFNYKLGIRSAVEWILDQYKEKKIDNPTIADKFNLYKYIDYKEEIIILIKKITTVSFKTINIIDLMKNDIV